MKKLFVETNGYNGLAFVDDNNKMYFVDCETIDEAKAMDISAIEDCKTAEDIDNAIGAGKGTFEFNAEDYENIIEL